MCRNTSRPNPTSDARTPPPPASVRPSLRRNTYYNLAGSLIPIAVTLVTVPPYIHQIGEARYGVLALVWILLGYFGFFDFGLSQATTYHISRLRAAPARVRESLLKTAVVSNLLIGSAGGLLLYAIAMPFVAHVFKMPAQIRPEVISALPWLAAGVPLATVSAVLFGALQGQERFGLVNILQVSGTVLFQVVPIAVAYLHGPELTWLIPAAILARAAILPLQFAVIRRTLPMGSGGRFRKRDLRPLLGYGGWISISSLIVPFLGTLGQMMIGAMMGATAVTHFVVPNRLLSRLGIFPAALTRALFPRLSGQTPDAASALSTRATHAMLGLATPLIVLVILSMPLFLSLWLSPEFSRVAAPLSAFMAIGTWLNILARTPSNHLQARGRPDITAKLHVVLIVLQVPLLWFGINHYGLIGAVLANMLISMLDVTLLLAISKLAVWRTASFWLAIAWVAGAVALTRIPHPDSAAIYAVYVVYFGACAIWSAWSTPDLRKHLLNKLSAHRRKNREATETA